MKVTLVVDLKPLDSPSYAERVADLLQQHALDLRREVTGDFGTPVASTQGRTTVNHLGDSLVVAAIDK